MKNLIFVFVGIHLGVWSEKQIIIITKNSDTTQACPFVAG